MHVGGQGNKLISPSSFWFLSFLSCPDLPRQRLPWLLLRLSFCDCVFVFLYVSLSAPSTRKSKRLPQPEEKWSSGGRKEKGSGWIQIRLPSGSHLSKVGQLNLEIAMHENIPRRNVHVYVPLRAHCKALAR